MPKGFPINGVNRGWFLKGCVSLMKGKTTPPETRFKQRLAKLRPLRDRIMSKVAQANGCWLWTGGIGSHGYGHFSFRDENGKCSGTPAHRAVYELLIGKIPEGLQLDHLCRNKQCVNPDHLEVVTAKENTQRHHRAKQKKNI